MKTIFNGNNILLKWFFTDAITGTDFVFDNADTKVTLYSCNYKKELNHSIDGNIIQSTIPSYLPVGVYTLECTYWVGIGAKRANVVIHEAFQVTRNTGALIEPELEFYSVAMPIFTSKIATVEYITEKRYKELETSQSLGKRTLYVVTTESGVETMYLYNKPLGGSGYPADEEDITLAEKTEEVENEYGDTVEKTTKVYKFKDRDTAKGKGYIILRTEKPLAEQMVQENTIYEIRYDFDLGGETLEVPAGCVLRFEGGCFDNGTINGNDTAITANPIRIFGDGLNISGYWQIDHAYAEWFGAKPNKIGDYTNPSDNIISIRKALAMNGNLKLIDGIYYISEGISMITGDKITGHKEGRTMIAPTSGSSMEALIIVDSVSHGAIRDLSLASSPNYGIKCYGSTQGFTIEDVSIKNCADAGLFVSKCWYASFKNLNIWKNKYGIKMVTTDTPAWSSAVNGISFENCWLNWNTENSIYCNGHTGAVSFNNCTIENTTNGPEVKCENLYTDMSFINCYMETKNIGFDVKPSYVTGHLTILGGIYFFNSPTHELANLGTLEEFICMGCSWIAQGTVAIPNSCIITQASVNVCAARFPDDANIFSATGKVVNLNTRGHHWNTKWNGCDARTWQTNNLRITHEGKGSQGSSASFSLGLNRDVNCDYDNCMKSFRIWQELTGEWSEDYIHFTIDKKDTSGNIVSNDIFTAKHNGDVQFKNVVRLSPVITNIVSSNLPNYSSWTESTRPVGLCYFCTDINKVAYLTSSGGTWVDAMGNVIKTYE